jgi:hypothetical protein
VEIVPFEIENAEEPFLAGAPADRWRAGSESPLDLDTVDLTGRGGNPPASSRHPLATLARKVGSHGVTALGGFLRDRLLPVCYNSRHSGKCAAGRLSKLDLTCAE